MIVAMNLSLHALLLNGNPFFFKNSLATSIQITDMLAFDRKVDESMSCAMLDN